ncbi:type II toxin-antitoxin system VapC family toxin [Pyramidobacter piscolens]|uniref:type II toxin-antitoxin system VapC family toxin n=1 Tax=Pyramidobacter piscolens TaxID=638849 RepID=UPI002490841F|nr:type II toxin-antitoxin system VapC family toxin [Pyramidobacter piscolens]
MSIYVLDGSLNTKLPKRAFFIDTSAWLTVLWAAEAQKKTKQSTIYAQFLESHYNDSMIFVTSPLQISEYWNLRIRKEHRFWQEENSSKHGRTSLKCFRNRHAHQYDIAVRVIRGELKEILHTCCLSQFYLDPESIMNATIQYRLDYNDAAYYLLCKERGLALITEDKDFCAVRGDIDIITTQSNFC